MARLKVSHTRSLRSHALVAGEADGLTDLEEEERGGGDEERRREEEEMRPLIPAVPTKTSKAHVQHSRHKNSWHVWHPSRYARHHPTRAVCSMGTVE